MDKLKTCSVVYCLTCFFLLNSSCKFATYIFSVVFFYVLSLRILADGVTHISDVALISMVLPVMLLAIKVVKVHVVIKLFGKSSVWNTLQTEFKYYRWLLQSLNVTAQ